MTYSPSSLGGKMEEKRERCICTELILLERREEKGQSERCPRFCRRYVTFDTFCMTLFSSLSPAPSSLFRVFNPWSDLLLQLRFYESR